MLGKWLSSVPVALALPDCKGDSNVSADQGKYGQIFPVTSSNSPRRKVWRRRLVREETGKEAREGGREGGRERGREGERERGREEEREGGRISACDLTLFLRP